MSRTERLLDLLQRLRAHRYPISGAALAAELDVSLRTVYRDVATLTRRFPGDRAAVRQASVELALQGLIDRAN